MTYTGSAGTTSTPVASYPLGYLNYLRLQTYLSSQLATKTTANYTAFKNNGGLFPSQFTLGGQLSATSSTSYYPWSSWSYDIYGYFPLATCTGCTTSGTTLTLGGTITGMFANGQVLLGKYVAGPGNGAGSQTTLSACSTSGSGPCGTNSGDTFTLSLSPTQNISAESMTGNIAPLDSTNSPITQWQGICSWNGNSCSWLLRRDLNPASNDNSPVGLDKAA
jgi:hypothetical protein